MIRLILFFTLSLSLQADLLIKESPDRVVPYQKDESRGAKSLQNSKIYYPYGDTTQAKIPTGKLIISFKTPVNLDEFAAAWELTNRKQISQMFDSWVFDTNGNEVEKASEIGKLDYIRYAKPEWQSTRIAK